MSKMKVTSHKHTPTSKLSQHKSLTTPESRSPNTHKYSVATAAAKIKKAPGC